MCASSAVSRLCVVRKFSCIKFHSLGTDQVFYCLIRWVYAHDVRLRDVCVCAVNARRFLWKFSFVKFHSLIHAYMCINDACNFIFTHQ